jgi:hypothetical protein
MPPSGVPGEWAEREQAQRLRKRCQHLGMLAAAHPLRIGDRLAPDLVEAERLEPRGDPFARLQIIRTAGEARADFGGQPFGELPGGIVAQGALAQLLGDRDVGGRDRGRLAGGECARCDETEGESERRQAHGRSLGGKRQLCAAPARADRAKCHVAEGAVA